MGVNTYQEFLIQKSEIQNAHSPKHPKSKTLPSSLKHFNYTIYKTYEF
jgi:hypothetical protein